MAVVRSESLDAAAAFRTSASRASPNHPPSSSASARIRWSFGAAAATTDSASRNRSRSVSASIAASSLAWSTGIARTI